MGGRNRKLKRLMVELRDGIQHGHSLHGHLEHDNFNRVRALGEAAIVAGSADDGVGNGDGAREDGLNGAPKEKDASVEAIRFSFADLEPVNSLAVALMLAWMRAAHVRNVPIVFADVPQDLRNIIEFSGLTDLMLVTEAA